MAKSENYSVKEAIEKALISLLSKKEYTEITVTDIVKEAKVARVSFYRHFSSISAVLDSIAEQTADNFNLSIAQLLDTTDDRKLREFLFSYFYQVSLNYKEMWSLGMINSGPISNILTTKFQQHLFNPDNKNETISGKYSCIAKLCLLDGIAKTWIADGIKETPEELIDYVMPILKMF